jgi:hypothetical protein
VHAAPPRSSDVLAGERPFGVRVLPVDHPDDVVTPEATLVVLPFADLGGELLPRMSAGGSRGRHRLALDNRGNAAVDLQLHGEPASEQVRLGLAPQLITVPPGEAVFARVRLRPVRRIWWGSPATHPFEVTATAPGGESVRTEGSYQQQPLLPRWLPKAVLAAVLAAALLLGFWFAAVRPAVTNTARDVAATQAANQVKSDVPAAVHSEFHPAPGQTRKSDLPPPPDPSPAAPTTAAPTSRAPARPATPAIVRTPTAQRIEVRDPAGGNSSSSSFVVPARRVLEITDIFLQNPQGDAGTIVISVDGEARLFAALENFRDDPYPLRTAIEVPDGSAFTVTVTCRQVGAPVGAPKPATCFESVFISGLLRTVPPPTAN